MRYLGPARIVLEGDKAKAKRHIGTARTLMGIMLNRMKLLGLTELVWRRRLVDGSVITVQKARFVKQIVITTVAPREEELDIFTGIVVLPYSDTAPNGWGFPYVDGFGDPINPPLGTIGGTQPEVIFSKDPVDSTISAIRSNDWYPKFGNNDLEDNICGGVDWQNLDGSIVITYGDMDDYRYARTVSNNKIFKDAQELTITGAFGSISAVGALVNETAENYYLLVAQVTQFGSWDEVKVIAYPRTDATLLVEDTSKTVDTLYTLYTNSLNASSDPTFFNSKYVRCCNFSPDGEHLVIVTEGGQLGELTINPTTLVTTLTDSIVHTASDSVIYDSGDFTESEAGTNNFSTSGCSDGSPPSTNLTISHVIQTIFLDREYTMGKASPETTVIYSDYDQTTGGRVDLTHTVEGDRVWKQLGNSTHFRGPWWDGIFNTCGGYPPGFHTDATIFDAQGLNRGDPQTFLGNYVETIDVLSSINITEAEHTIKLGTTVLETFQNTWTYIHTQDLDAFEGTVLHNITVYASTVDVTKFHGIHDADLRTGFIAYMISNFVGSASGPAFGDDTINSVTETLEHKVVGGSYLPDDSYTDTATWTQIQINNEFLGDEDFVINPLSYSKNEFKREVPTNPTPDVFRFVLQNSPTHRRLQLGVSDLGGIQHRQASNMQIALVDARNPYTITNTDFWYNKFTEGDPATIAETQGDNPRVKPLSVI